LILPQQNVYLEENKRHMYQNFIKFEDNKT